MQSTTISRNRLITLLLSATVLCLAQAAPAQTGDAQSRERPAETYKARLSTVPIDVSMMATVAGSGSLTATLAGRKLTINGTFEGLRSPATVARVHRAPKGIRGPAVFDLTATNATSGSISGSLDLNAAQIEDLKNGRLYVQLYSEKAPDGNLWGWLLRN